MTRSPVNPHSPAGAAMRAVLIHLAARRLAQPVDIRPIEGSAARAGGLRWEGGEPLHPMGDELFQLYDVRVGTVVRLDFDALVMQPNVQTETISGYGELVLVCREVPPQLFADAVALTLVRGAHALTVIINPRDLTCDYARRITLTDTV